MNISPPIIQDEVLLSSRLDTFLELRRRAAHYWTEVSRLADAQDGQTVTSVFGKTTKITEVQQWINELVNLATILENVSDECYREAYKHLLKRGAKE